MLASRGPARLCEQLLSLQVLGFPLALGQVYSGSFHVTLNLTIVLSHDLHLTILLTST